MSKRLWCGLYTVSLVLLVISMLIAAVVGMLTSDEILGPAGLGGAISALVLGYLQFVVVHTICTLVLLFKMWKVLEDGVTPVTAGKAVGFLFIPFFNIYWFFRVWGGYPTEYNKYLERYRLNTPRLSGGIFIAFAVAVGLTAVLIIPIIVLPFVTIILLARGCDAINNLELSKAAAAEQRVLTPADFVGTPENPRSKTPIFALAGAAALLLIGLLGFGVFAWFNMNPKPSADVLPATVANFTLQQPGSVTGSFFGGKFATLDNIYVSEAGGSRQAIRYNVFQFSSADTASKHLASFCDKSSPDVLKTQDGKEAGHLCIESGSVSMQVGRYFMWAHEPFGYHLEKAQAKGAPLDTIVSFIKALPIAKDIAFSDARIPVSTTTSTTSSTTPNVVLSKTSGADFNVTGKEFYDETNGGSSTAKTKYNGKTVQITARVAIASADSLMLSAGSTGSLFAYFDPSQASTFSALKRDERVVVKCSVTVEYSVKLENCVLIENKGIISPSDTPDVTFTAEEYWKTIASYDIPTSARMKKQDELAGKIVKITGKVKDMGGTKSYLMAGSDDEIACFPDDENKAMFSSLSEGQSVSFLAVGGSSLSHCVVASN